MEIITISIISIIVIVVVVTYQNNQSSKLKIPSNIHRKYNIYRNPRKNVEEIRAKFPNITTALKNRYFVGTSIKQKTVMT